MKRIVKAYDVVIAGGGLAGLCCGIAAAREGASVALVHDRPMLGGNASSEIRMHICGADHHGSQGNRHFGRDPAGTQASQSADKLDDL